MFSDVLLDLVMFPVWWYSRGLVLLLTSARNTLKSYAQYLAVAVWLKNIFVPMFGQNDWQSRLISIFMRSVQIVGRLLALAFIALGILLFVLAYLIAPITLMLLAAYNVIGSLLYVA